MSSQEKVVRFDGSGNLLVGRKAADRHSSKIANGASKITNGNLFADNAVDGRSPWARRLRDLIQINVNELGGTDVVSAREYSIIRRGSTQEVELELLERKFAMKGDGASAEDLDLYSRVSNTMRRHYEAVGLRRRAKDVTPALSEHFAEHYAEDDETDDEVIEP
jgi:hypothetical protein